MAKDSSAQNQLGDEAAEGDASRFADGPDELTTLRAENENLKSLVSYLRNELQCIFQLSELVERHNYKINLIQYFGQF